MRGQVALKLGLSAALLLVTLVLAAGAGAERAESRTRALSHGYLAMGLDHTCALLDDGTVHCWGAAFYGQLGLGNQEDMGDDPAELPAAPAPLGGAAVAISALEDHTCALLADGRVRCWGSNSYGQLGLGHTVSRGEEGGQMPTPAVPLGHAAVAVSAAVRHSCALLDDGAVHCWGDNGEGQLGLGDITTRGDDPNELPTAAVPLGRAAVAVSAGFAHSCALLDDGTVHCWGNNSFGQLGLGDTASRGDGPGELPTAAVPLGRTAVALSSGDNHNCALLDDGAVQCWGENGSGRLGLGDVNHRGDAPGELPTAAVPLGRATVAVASAYHHNCALLDDGTVHCWGHNTEGQLGLGDVNHRGDAPGELPTAAVSLGRTVVAVGVGGRHSCALLDDGTLHCWGGNNDGELGLSDDVNRGDALGELPTGAVPLVPRVRRASDVSLALGASSETRQVGEQVTLTYTVANAGPDPVDAIQTGLGLPGMTLDSGTPSQGTFDAASQSWRAGALDPRGVAVLSVVATVRVPGVLIPSGEVIAADALDDDSTPANGAAEDDRASTTVTAASPIPARAALDSLILSSKAKRDRSKPYSFAVTGAAVVTRVALAGACSGTVTIAVTKGKAKTISAKGKLKLSKSAGTCTYRATIKLPSKAKAGNYTATASFPGNAVVEGKTSKKLALRAG